METAKRGRGRPPKDIAVITQQVQQRRYTDMRDAMDQAMIISHDVIDDDPDPYGYATELEQEFGVDLITPNWKAKPDDDRWVKRYKARARKAAVARLFLLGHTMAAISQKVGVSITTVLKDIDSISLEWRKSYLSDVEDMAARDLARLDHMIMRLAKKIERGDVNAIRAATDIIDRRAKILGYGAGVQVDIEQYIREVAESAGYDPDQAVMIAQRISVSFKG